MLDSCKNISSIYKQLGIINNHYYDDIKRELKNDHYICSSIGSDLKISWREYNANDKLVSTHADEKVNLSLYPYGDRGWLVGNILQ